jgi:hypothetical protein
VNVPTADVTTTTLKSLQFFSFYGKDNIRSKGVNASGCNFNDPDTSLHCPPALSPFHKSGEKSISIVKTDVPVKEDEMSKKYDDDKDFCRDKIVEVNDFEDGEDHTWVGNTVTNHEDFGWVLGPFDLHYLTAKKTLFVPIDASSISISFDLKSTGNWENCDNVYVKAGGEEMDLKELVHENTPYPEDYDFSDMGAYNWPGKN